ncbi:hypothetical protein HH310_04965 [Actinoplanes sp. TBRC 11911]|uniref:DUF6218 family protein n=1 Tax=Actinoplanes sp. TBRC 11911 TaxID=2729386 RepID=UPI00145E34A4|nr:DUF6218 family protein [Actinoplanes sp. TBRC 11911]NMO50544.1 hypothetical protein [Actinoplanes sp. TBRC 11911]
MNGPAVVQLLDSHHRRSPNDRLVVCATGADEAGAESLALWWTDLSGEPKAGWLFPVDLAEQDAAVAQRLLAAGGYGRPAGRGPATGWGVLAHLARQAGLPGSGYGPSDVLDVDELVSLVRDRTSVAAPPQRFTGHDPCPVVANLLETCRLIGWATRAWSTRVGLADEPSPLQRWLGREPVSEDLP